MAEGKILALEVPCSLCDEDESVKFCVDCNQNLCQRCAKLHGKIEALSHHKLISIKDIGTSGARPKTTQAYCTEHTSKPLSVICEDCLCALCDTCADKAHKNHKLVRTNLNATLLQRISAQKVPEFMDVLHQLEKEKDGSPIKLQLYKTARDMVKSWRDQIWKIVEQDSEKLLKGLEKEIKKQETLLADIASTLGDAVQTADKQMSELSNARKISDPAVLMFNIHEGDLIIGKAKTLLRDIEKTRKRYTIDDVLPFRNEFDNTEKSLHSLFTLATMDDITNKEQAQPLNYHSMTIQGKYDVVKVARFDTLRISNTHQRNCKAVVMYTTKTSNISNTSNIHVFDVESKQKKQYTCGKSIHRMATLSDDRHVMIDIGWDVHLLDGNFHVVRTLDKVTRQNNKPQGVCAVSNDTFLLSENSKDNKGAKLSEVRISQSQTFSTTKLFEVDFYDEFGLLTLYNDIKRITRSPSSKVLHTVDLKTGQVTKLDLNLYFRTPIFELYVDDTDQLLVSDCEGHVHLASPTKYKGILPNMEREVAISGISIRGDKVITVTGGSINIYK